jgi:hypothetical protein
VELTDAGRGFVEEAPSSLLHNVQPRLESCHV